MNTVVVSDAAAVLRATGILKAYIAGDEDHVNAVFFALLEDNSELSALHTFGAMVKIAAALAQSAGDRALDNIQRQLVADEQDVTL